MRSTTVGVLVRGQRPERRRRRSPAMMKPGKRAWRLSASCSGTPSLTAVEEARPAARGRALGEGQHEVRAVDAAASRSPPARRAGPDHRHAVRRREPGRVVDPEQFRVALALHHAVHAGHAHVVLLASRRSSPAISSRPRVMSTALTRTPRMSTRRISAAAATRRPLGLHSAAAELASRSTGTCGRAPPRGDRRLPAEHLAEPRVVGVAAADALRSRDVPDADVPLAGDLDDDPGQLVDRDHPVGAEVEGLGVVRPHQAVDALDAVVDVAERPRLLAVAPDLDLAAVLDAARPCGRARPAPSPGRRRRSRTGRRCCGSGRCASRSP